MNHGFKWKESREYLTETRTNASNEEKRQNQNCENPTVILQRVSIIKKIGNISFFEHNITLIKLFNVKEPPFFFQNCNKK
jgi:hypothetical protein